MLPDVYNMMPIFSSSGTLEVKVSSGGILAADCLEDAAFRSSYFRNG